MLSRLAIPLLAGIAAQAGAGEIVCELQEAPISEVPRGKANFNFWGDASFERDPEVKSYPPFRSEKPVFGSLRVKSMYGAPGSGVLLRFAIDESEGTGKGYDRFYCDIDGDLDLTDDPPRGVRPAPAGEAGLLFPSAQPQASFDPLPVETGAGDGDAPRAEVVPSLFVYKGDRVNVRFVPARIRKGEISLAGVEYDVLLGHDGPQVGLPFNVPRTALFLVPKAEGSRRAYWSGSDRLMALHAIGGTLYRFSATPSGDRLTARPYDGDLGVFEVGAGGRQISSMDVAGSLLSDTMAVAVGGEIEEGRLTPAPRCLLPVGDYLPAFLTLTFGKLRVTLSQNRHSDGRPRDRAERPEIYGVAIRKDKPFRFDFSGKPEVMFASPAKGARVRRGEKLIVSAVLTDAGLDIMIRDIEDTTRKVKRELPLLRILSLKDKTKEKTPARTITVEQNVSLDPKVVITRTDGERVAEGVMPFG